MARKRRETPGGLVYHVFNRGSRKGEIFDGDGEYLDFEALIEQEQAKAKMRIVAYCLMRTHFHFLLWPHSDHDISRFMQRLTSRHARRWHRARGTTGTGAVYQSRYCSKPIFDAYHYFSALRYVERNALAANYVKRAEAWRWGSATTQVEPPCCIDLSPGPFPRPKNWLDLLNVE
jgi:REP element-mobilizing transposase RayT